MPRQMYATQSPSQPHRALRPHTLPPFALITQPTKPMHAYEAFAKEALRINIIFILFFLYDIVMIYTNVSVAP